MQFSSVALVSHPPNEHFMLDPIDVKLGAVGPVQAGLSSQLTLVIRGKPGLSVLRACGGRRDR